MPERIHHLEPNVKIYPFAKSRGFLPADLVGMYSDFDEEGGYRGQGELLLREKLLFQGVSGYVDLKTSPDIEHEDQFTPYGPVKAVKENNNGVVTVVGVPLYIAMGFEVANAREAESIRFFNAMFTLNSQNFVFNYWGHNNPSLGEDVERAAKKSESGRAALEGDMLYPAHGPREMNRLKPLLPFKLPSLRTIGLEFQPG